MTITDIESDWKTCSFANPNAPGQLQVQFRPSINDKGAWDVRLIVSERTYSTTTRFEPLVVRDVSQLVELWELWYTQAVACYRVAGDFDISLNDSDVECWVHIHIPIVNIDIELEFKREWVNREAPVSEQLTKLWDHVNELRDCMNDLPRNSDVHKVKDVVSRVQSDIQSMKITMARIEHMAYLNFLPLTTLTYSTEYPKPNHRVSSSSRLPWKVREEFNVYFQRDKTPISYPVSSASHMVRVHFTLPIDGTWRIVISNTTCMHGCPVNGGIPQKAEPLYVNGAHVPVSETNDESLTRIYIGTWDKGTVLTVDGVLQSIGFSLVINGQFYGSDSIVEFTRDAE